jgi:serine/threonine-protein kinase
VADAHALGVVHRDIKPANLFLTKRRDQRPLVKVVDFGIAKQVTRNSLVALTGPQMVLGSPLYMSPEQLCAKDVGPASDVWSLGVTLYELVTGSGPFAGETDVEVSASVLKDAPRPPSERRQGMPASLDAVIMRCLRREPRQRYPDARALAEALTEVLVEIGADPGYRASVPMSVPGSVPVPISSSGAKLGASMDTQTETDIPVIPPLGAKGLRLLRPLRPTLVGIVVALAIPMLGALVFFLFRPSPAPRIAESSSANANVSASSSAGSSSGEATTEPAADELEAVAMAAASGPRTATSARLRKGGRAPHASAHSPMPPTSSVTPSVHTTNPSTPSTSPPTPAPAAPPAAPGPPATAQPGEAPRFVLASARVDLGAATNAVGTKPSNVNRAVAPAAAKLTACYRDALPHMTGALEGPGVLHVETDEDGVIVSARVAGPAHGAAACIAAAVAGRKVADVDTGRARADVPLTFHSQ